MDRAVLVTEDLPFERKATAFIIFVENTLGWIPPVTEKTPLWKARAVEAGKLNKKIKTNPRLYTWENLALAVEYCRRKKQEVRSPTALCWTVERALREAYQPADSTPVQAQVDAAIAWEQTNQLDDADTWIGRLTRAGGDGRKDVLNEWRQERQP